MLNLKSKQKSAVIREKHSHRYHRPFKDRAVTGIHEEDEPYCSCVLISGRSSVGRGLSRFLFTRPPSFVTYNCMHLYQTNAYS